MNDKEHNETFRPDEFPLLAGAGRKTPFKVPDGYFALLEQEMQKRVKKEVSTPHTSYISRIATSMVAAAAIYLAFITIFKPDASNIELNSDEIVTYLDSYSSEIDLDDPETALLFESIEIPVETDLYPEEEAIEYLEEVQLDDLDLAGML